LDLIFPDSSDEDEDEDRNYHEGRTTGKIDDSFTILVRFGYSCANLAKPSTCRIFQFWGVLAFVKTLFFDAVTCRTCASQVWQVLVQNWPICRDWQG
jgi:hypothetical protein